MWRPLTLAMTIGLGAALPAMAHDFWVEAETYTPAPGEEVPVYLFVGHGSDKSDWPIQPHRIIGFRSVGPDGLRNLTAGAASLNGDLTFTPETEGLHMVFVETTNSFSELDAEKFDAYAEEEGIRPIMMHRAAQRGEAEMGRELYSRRGKALLKSGCAAGDDETWAQELGLTLEVVPLANPIGWSEGEPLPVAVHYHGEPVPAATLHVTNLDDEKDAFTVQTDQSGQADLAPSMSEGRWLVHTVWAEPADNLLQEADYQTIFSSLTFDTVDPCEAS